MITFDETSTQATSPPPPSADVARVAAAMTGADVVELIALEACSPATYNPRQFPVKPSGALIQLALSIRRTGQVQPATVRRLGDRYEIVCGERRWRACCLRSAHDRIMEAEKGVVSFVDGAAGDELTAAGSPPHFLRAVVRELTDEQAMEICAVENLDREDLAPLEEAAGVATLLQLYRGDVEAVASRLRRPISWVAARERLNTLSLKWRTAIAKEGSEFHTWTAAHFAEISKLAPAAQDLVLGRFRYDVAGASVADVRKAIGGELRTLGLAPFDVEDAALVPKCGACSTCPHTSASTPGLFADEGDEIRPSALRKARCLNPTCWDGKVLAHAQVQVRELRKKHGDAAIVASEDFYRLPGNLQQKARRVGDYSEYSKAKEGAKGAWPGVYAVGEKAGQVAWFTKREKHAVRGSKKGDKAEKTVTPLKERRAGHQRRREALAVAKIAAAIEKASATPNAEDLLCLLATFGSAHKLDGASSWDPDYQDRGTMSEGDPWKRYDALLRSSDAQLKRGWQKVRPVLLARLKYWGSQTDTAQLLRGARRTADLVKVDHEALWQAAVAELPEPKSWAALAQKEKAARKAERPKAAAAATNGASTSTAAKKSGRRVSPAVAAAVAAQTPAEAAP